MTSLEGKVALVTGASRGIGAAVARALAERDVRLVLASRSGDDLGLEGVLARPCDVRRAADLEGIVAEAIERFGRLDLLVANAGVGAYGPFLELDPEHLEEMIDVNVKGTLYAVRAALPYLVESPEADIVTIASEAGRRGLPLEAVYCASKFAPGRLHTRARPRAPRPRRALHEHLPGRRRDRLRHGEGPHARDAGARGDDDLRGRRRGGRVRPHAPAQPPDPRDCVPPGDGALLGMTVARLWLAPVGETMFPPRAPFFDAVGEPPGSPTPPPRAHRP